MICEKVPVFKIVAPPYPEGEQLFKLGGAFYIRIGTRLGCGKEYQGPRCPNCQGDFLPLPVDRPGVKSRRAPMDDGKKRASDEKEAD